MSEATNAGWPAIAIRTISRRCADRRPAPRLVRRRAGRDQPDPVQAAGLPALLGQDQVPQVDRVECPAVQSQSHLPAALTVSLIGISAPRPGSPTIDFVWTNVQKSVVLMAFNDGRPGRGRRRFVPGNEDRRAAPDRENPTIGPGPETCQRQRRHGPSWNGFPDAGRMMHEYDKSSKWLIEHHGDSILRLGGVRGIEWWRSLQAELVQSRRLPDGLIEAKLRQKAEPVRFLVEISTYPYRRLSKQVVDGTLLTHLNRGELPEVLTLVLHPGGRKRVAGAAELVSPHGWTRLHLEWKVVELWTIPAADLLAADDVGLIPWVPLAKIDGPPEPIFRECRARIDRDAPRGDRQNLLAVTQFLAHLNYNDPRLFQVLGGRKAMIESPVLRELMAENYAEDNAGQHPQGSRRAIRARGPSPGAGAQGDRGRQAVGQTVDPIREVSRSGVVQEAARAMRVAPAKDDDDRRGAAREGYGRENGHAPAGDGEPVASQSAWFGLADEQPTVTGVYAGLVFNRPIEQILTYGVPARLAGVIRVGQRVRAPLGRGDKLASGYCVRVDACFQVGGELADRLLDHLGVVTAAEVGHTLGDRHHGAHRGAAVRPADHRHVGAAELEQRRLGSRSGAKLKRLAAVVEVLLLDDRLEQVMLVGEVDVERALRHAGDAGNLAHAGAVEAEIEKHAARAVEDLLPLGGIFLARPRGGFAQGLGARCNHLFSVTGSCAAAATGW